MKGRASSALRPAMYVAMNCVRPLQIAGRVITNCTEYGMKQDPSLCTGSICLHRYIPGIGTIDISRFASKTLLV